MARGLRDRATQTRAESSDTNATRTDMSMREDIEQGGVFPQSTSLEERAPSHIRRSRGSFGHPEGFIRRPRFGNPGGIGALSVSTVKSLGELIGLESVDVEIHSALGWIMSGLLGPARDPVGETHTLAETNNTDDALGAEAPRN